MYASAVSTRLIPVERVVDDADRVGVVRVADGGAQHQSPSAYGLTLMQVRPSVR
jgi:hypothetical protein